MKASKRKGWRVSKSGSVYRAKGKVKSRRKTYSSKASAKRAAKRK